MKTESVEIVDFELRRHQKNLSEMIRVADKLGFIGITENGKRISYLVSAKLWRTGVLDSDAITGITKRGKMAAYVVPLELWNVWMLFLGAFTPAGRRRLPGLARAQAMRDAREAKRLKKQRAAGLGVSSLR